MNAPYLVTATSVLITSLLGSAHCAAMCGGFATLVAGSGARSSFKRIAPYHLGRLTAYIAAGLGASQLGALVSPIIVGSLLIAAGIIPLFSARLVPSFVHRSSTQLYRRAIGWIPRESAAFPLVVGAASALLPCGWLYLYAGVAAAGPAPITTMIAFWIGTLPILTVWATSSAWIIQRLGKLFPPLRAIVLVSAGIFALTQHLSVSPESGHCHHHHE